MIPLLVIGILEQFYLIEIEYIEIKIEITGTSLLGAPRRSCFCSSRSSCASCSSCSCSPADLLPLLHLSPSCRSLPASAPARSDFSRSVQFSSVLADMAYQPFMRLIFS